jgi:hypothetical protein
LLPFLPGGHNPLFGEPLFGVMFLKENIRGLCMSIDWEHLVKTNLVETSFKNACDVTLSVYPHRAGLKNMPGHGFGYTLRVTSHKHLIHLSTLHCKYHDY